MDTRGAPAATSDSCGGMIRHCPARDRGGHRYDSSALASLQNALYTSHAAGKIVANSAAMPAPHIAMQLVAWSKNEPGGKSRNGSNVVERVKTVPDILNQILAVIETMQCHHLICLSAPLYCTISLLPNTPKLRDEAWIVLSRASGELRQLLSVEWQSTSLPALTGKLYCWSVLVMTMSLVFRGSISACASSARRGRHGGVSG